MSEATKSSNIQTLVDKLSSLKKEAYSVLDQSLSFDSNESDSNPQKCDQSIIMYEKCLSLIDKALGFYEQNKSIFVKNDNAVTMYSHLVSIRNQTLERVNKLKSDRMKIANQNSIANLNTEFLAIGEEILNTDDYLIIDDFDEELNEQDAKGSDNKRLDNFAKANEILRVDDGVQLFYIANDGTVSTPSYPTSLSIYSFMDQEDKKMGGFIRVGDWMYPLVPNESPGMKTNFNAYIFPNNDENQNSAKFSFVGITFSENVNNEQKQFFEDVLSNLSSLIFQDSNSESGVKRPMVTPDSQSSSQVLPSSTASTSRMREKQSGEKIEEKINKEKENDENMSKSWSAERIAQNIINGAQYLSNGVSTGTEYATKYLRTGGDKLKSNLEPTPEPVSVNPTIKKAAQNVRYGTHVTVRVSSFLLNKLSSIANSTAKTIAPHLKNGSAALLSGVTSKSNASNYVENVCTVAHGSFQGFGIVYDSLEGAAKTLSKNVADETVTVLDHKYGSDVAKVAENGLYSAGNVALSVNNFRNLKVVRTIAKATAKETLSNKSKLNEKNVETTNNDAKKEK